MNTLLVYVQTSATGVYYSHVYSFCRERRTQWKTDDFPSRALRLTAEATIRCATHNQLLRQRPDHVHRRALRTRMYSAFIRPGIL